MLTLLQLKALLKYFSMIRIIQGMRMMFFQSVTQVAPNQIPASDLLATTPDALPLSYR